MPTITYKQLQDADACREQRALFKTLFGESVEVTEAACLAVADKFNWDWAAQHLLPAPAWAEYKRVRAAAWAEYAAAWAEYERVAAPAWAGYERVRAAAFGGLYV